MELNCFALNSPFSEGEDQGMALSCFLFLDSHTTNRVIHKIQIFAKGTFLDSGYPRAWCLLLLSLGGAEEAGTAW